MLPVLFLVLSVLVEHAKCFSVFWFGEKEKSFKTHTIFMSFEILQMCLFLRMVNI